MVKTIYLREVLTEMKKLDDKKNPIPFTIEVKNYNKQNGRGGRHLIYRNATLMQPPKQKGVKRLAMQMDFKRPNHYANRTRNVKVDGVIKKIHVIFIIKFNGLEVIL